MLYWTVFMGWGAFHFGFSNNTDPEPGRCRRTDGKKWRCSRDAVVDQKYCERHMNRGRHRSRKPVEQGHLGHAGIVAESGTTTATTTTPNTTTSASNSLTFVPHQEHKNMQPPLASDTSPTININSFMNNNKENDASERVHGSFSLPMLPPTLELKPKEQIPFMAHKQQIPSYEESARKDNEFGLVTSDSLLNPSQKSPALLGSRSFSSSQNQQTEPQHSLRHFIDDCPNDDMQSDSTQLSISIPMTASADFMSFSSSTPTDEKLTLSSLRLSRELDPIQMSLGTGSSIDESNTRQASWIPITWESCSMGGPLGEVLNLSNNNNNNNASDHCSKNSSALNLMTDGWDNSPPIGSSPTGILQKTAFGSLSNSSAGSSPRADTNKTQESAINSLDQP
ncbi:putative transcription factor interactor and regulator C3H-WRC/GRF family [Lupinus albus]|uniref:Growth-regulating factor n=1 Tax=Lupinus albus TaxID=3870 RepID=A0A6A4NI08_LUPAL|nr:putative transcription factor interactor and regulator C3H-WRC/GRF family [Lupinus albus]